MQEEQLRSIINIAKENKKRLYKLIWKNYGNLSLLIDGKFEMVTDLFPKFLWDNYEDKGYARQLKVFYAAFEPILNDHPKTELKGRGWFAFVENRSEIARVCEALHKRYWARFHKYIYPQKVRNAGGNIPTMNRTEALKEFLAMGFVYKTDIELDQKNYYYIYAHIGGLWYPEKFTQHQDALAIQVKYGIPGLTGTTLPKK